MTGQSAGKAAHEFFDVSIDAGVAHLRLNRPDHLNSMARGFWSELPAIVRDIDDDARARVIVLSSTGKHFSAGMDLSVFAGNGALAETSPDAHVANEAFRHLVLRLQETFSCLDEARIPVIAAIQGGCIGGAVDMASACDIRYCTADAFFCIQEINIGMAADLGVLQRLPKLIPQGVVRELAYTGDRLPASRALELGLVNAVLPDAASLLDHAMNAARSIANKSPLAITGSKLALNHARDHGTAAALHQMTLLQSAIFDTAEMAEAIDAWKTKRDAQFQSLTPVASDKG